jgi:hypothetical protein
MNTYEVGFQFQQGALKWTDRYTIQASGIKELSEKIDNMISEWDLNHAQYNFQCSMQVTFAQDMEHEHDDCPDDITNDLPQHLLNY